ncbi:UDP-2,3-diacylglucosamine diphosphatase [Kushneria phosphatilytica]|uniref:UDP-2,3-diacylglucosamine hydrolase n=1 Tax=Kushneria phosphatilytica TaxID=657387 RepID=A0A1S1NYB6_9GAMM|nr:UDP-2,3-diacylglucosamine diphosphatase [Kushneria phosphatilytica]OHV11843.1 UDP-2,3-diacylglucosamine diphosphatase [Kushneria phosphatilytica]QEL11015.1 UDP-2,3-diacylglucosamine diphosphatase [Kushneria phosphatilytica]
MTTLFIADLHLHSGAPGIAEGFINYLRHRASGADALYILGDLFEGWIGDDGSGPFEERIIEALRECSDGGTNLYFMHGNRDFLIGEDFSRRTGALLLDEHETIELEDGRPALLMHGDSLCTMDREYMQFRAMTRDPEWQQRTLAMPLEQRQALAGQLREHSQSANQDKQDDIMDVTPQAVIDVMAEWNVDTLIHGHTHRPAEHDLTLPDGTPARRHVLGDWDESNGWQLRLEGNQLTLERFSLQGS